METELDDLWTEKEVATFLRCTTAALRRWRKLGQGPRFVRVGKRMVRYPVREVAEFIAKRDVQS